MWPPPEWFVQSAYALLFAVIVFILLYLAQKASGVELAHVLHLVISERQEAKAGSNTVGAWNWRAVVLLVRLGLAYAVFSGLQKWTGVLGTALNFKKAEELISYTNYAAFFYFTAIFLLLSLFFKFWDDKERRKKRSLAKPKEHTKITSKSNL